MKKIFVIATIMAIIISLTILVATPIKIILVAIASIYLAAIVLSGLIYVKNDIHLMNKHLRRE